MDNITPEKNLLLAPFPRQNMVNSKRVTGTKKGWASSMKKSKSEVVHNPIQNVHHPSDSK
tara:strand:+ start:152 stop:331 length:180 start_codon:yes stop_codon:yes gene_type:complete